MPRARKKDEPPKDYKDFAEKIKERAKGIVCEDCPFVNWFPAATWGKCQKNVSITGEFLETSKSAPACKHHPRLKALLAAST